MKGRRWIATAAGVFGAILLAGCESTSSAPPQITPALVQAGVRHHATAESLTRGRTLFTTRCATCHVLPAVSEHTAESWPQIISEMAARSHLSPRDREAVVAYLLTVRGS